MSNWDIFKIGKYIQTFQFSRIFITTWKKQIVYTRVKRIVNICNTRWLKAYFFQKGDISYATI